MILSHLQRHPNPFSYGHGTDTGWRDGTGITERIVKSFRVPKTGNRMIYDNEIPGFGVRITAGGVMSFILNYHDSRPRASLHDRTTS